MASTKRGDASAASTWGEPPALLTSTSSRPKCSTALAMTRSASGGLRTSAVTNTAPSTSASWRPQATTCAPAAANAATMPAPTPREPPVTTTTRSLKSKIGLGHRANPTARPAERPGGPARLPCRPRWPGRARWPKFPPAF